MAGRHELQKLKKKAKSFRPDILDNCNYSSLEDGFARAVLMNTKYGADVAKFDDFELIHFLKENNLHSDIDLIQFALDNCTFDVADII